MRIKNVNSKKLLIVGLAVLLLVALAVGIAWAYYKPTSPPTSGISQLSKDKSRSDKKKVAIGQTNAPVQPNATAPDSVDPSSIKPYALVTENETYKIRELNGNYVITLYAIINRPDQADSYRDQLRQYKYDALDYLKQHSIDLTKVNIAYEPAEAKDL